jgi:enoyl-CoA hydratase/carnithine racemase
VSNEYQFLQYEKKKHIAYVTLNRPGVMNALHPPLVRELDAVWTDYIHDPEAWVAILTGAGERAFCAGTDLKYRVDEADEGTLRNPTAPSRHVLDRCYKPIIAAINGYAVGGGLELALHCDILIAANHAKLGLPEPRRGLLADEGGIVRLPRRLPYHLAMGLVLTGRLISAEDALRIGLVNAVVPADQLMSTAESWANDVLECGPLAVQAAKQVILETLDLPAAEAINRLEVLEAVRRLRASEDYAEGPRAFAEKRKPVWQGK